MRFSFKILILTIALTLGVLSALFAVSDHNVVAFKKIGMTDSSTQQDTDEYPFDKEMYPLETPKKQ